MNLWRSEEIEHSRLLRLFGSFLCFYHLVSWWQWTSYHNLAPQAIARGAYLPILEPSWWQHTLVIPQSALPTLLRGLALLSAAAGWGFAAAPRLNGWCLALAGLTLCKAYFYLHNLCEVANFHHMHLLFCVVFLLASHKLFYLRWTLALVYWMAALVKFTPSWYDGEYFNSVPARLPWVPQVGWMVTAACRLLIVTELVVPFALLSRSRRARQVALLIFGLFHLYSGLIVGWWYTCLMIPALLTAFGDGSQETPRPALDRRGVAVYAISAFVFLMNSWHWTVPGDARITGEGRYHGLFMFDCNRRAWASLEVVKGEQAWSYQFLYGWPRREIGDQRAVDAAWTHQGNGGWRPLSRGEVRADDGTVLVQPALLLELNGRILNDPYVLYCWAELLQQRFHPDRIAIKLWTQIDGQALAYQTLDIHDFARECAPYSFWHHNSWIRLDPPVAVQPPQLGAQPDDLEASLRKPTDSPPGAAPSRSAETDEPVGGGALPAAAEGETATPAVPLSSNPNAR